MTQRFKYSVDLFSSTVFLSCLSSVALFYCWVCGLRFFLLQSQHNTRATDTFDSNGMTTTTSRRKKIIQLARLSVLQISTGFRVTLRTFFPLLSLAAVASHVIDNRSLLTANLTNVSHASRAQFAFFYASLGFFGLICHNPSLRPKTADCLRRAKVHEKQREVEQQKFTPDFN